MLFFSELMLAAGDQIPFIREAEWVIYSRILSATHILGVCPLNQCAVWSKIKFKEFSFLQVVYQLYAIISKWWVCLWPIFSFCPILRPLVCPACMVFCLFEVADLSTLTWFFFFLYSSPCPCGRKHLLPEESPWALAHLSTLSGMLHFSEQAATKSHMLSNDLHGRGAQSQR